MDRKIIAVDFDGTLCEEKYPLIGEPKEKVIEYIKMLKKWCGCILILWTCRSGDELKKAVEWCKGYGLEFDYVNENLKEHIEKYGHDTRKIYADFYVDDKNHDIDEVMYKMLKRGIKNE